MTVRDSETFPDIEAQISELLKKKKRNYLTATQLKNSLSAVLLKHLGLTKTSSRPADILNRLKPYLGNAIGEYKSSRYSYIGFAMSLKDMIKDKIRKNPGISSKNLAKDLPMSKKEFISHLNNLLESGEAVCTFNENCIPCLKLSARVGAQIRLEEADVDVRCAFEAAYRTVGKGQKIVRIHRIREYLNWPRRQFDETLKSLMADYTIELHGGDPSAMSDKEIKGSFAGDDGLLYINLTWWGKNDEH